MDIINKNIKIVFWLVVLLQLIFLGGLIGYKQYAILAGEKIILKVAPVDPRSLFQGDYARLNYEINRLDLSKIEVEGEKNFRGDEKVYVELEKGDKYFSPRKVSREKPKTKYFIRGIAQNFSGNSLQVMYGIETYFMPEGKARDFENVARGGRGADILIGVSVDKFGQGLIDKIIIDGQEIEVSDFKEVSDISRDIRSNTMESNFANSRNTKRWSHVKAILNAIGQSIADNKGNFNCSTGLLPTLKTQLGSGSGNYNIEPCIVPVYISLMPLDPLGGLPEATGYVIIYSTTTKRVTISSLNAELGEQISITR